MLLFPFGCYVPGVCAHFFLVYISFYLFVFVWLFVCLFVCLFLNLVGFSVLAMKLW